MADDDLLTERLLRVVDEGRRTATYKLALLLALIDAAALNLGESHLSTRDIARLVIEIYYPQTRVYMAHDGISRELRQISMKSSPPLQATLRLRLRAEASGCKALAEVIRRLPQEYDTTLDRVEDTFVRYPIPLLQVVGQRIVPFLYDVEWEEGTSVVTLRREGRDRIRFLDGVADRLVVLGPLLRPLIELHWARDVARWTGIRTEEKQLREHLFGVERSTFPPSVRAGLRELQAGECFYCGAPLVGRAQVDHFLAWSRWPNDAVENLVLADECNGYKSDHLAAANHVHRWVTRARDHGQSLVEIAAAARWPSDPNRSRALLASTYGTVARGTPLWISGREFTQASGPMAIA